MESWKYLLLSAFLLVIQTPVVSRADSFNSLTQLPNGSYELKISGSGFSCDFVLKVTPVLSYGAYEVTGISGWFSTPDAGKLTSSPQNPFILLGNGAQTHNDGMFEWDNLLFPGKNGVQILDYYGLLIDVGGYELNLFSDGSLFAYGDNAELHEEMSIAPEPSPLLLLGSGLLAIAFVIYGRHRRIAVRQGA